MNSNRDPRSSEQLVDSIMRLFQIDVDTPAGDIGTVSLQEQVSQLTDLVSALSRHIVILSTKIRELQNASVKPTFTSEDMSQFIRSTSDKPDTTTTLNRNAKEFSLDSSSNQSSIGREQFQNVQTTNESSLNGDLSGTDNMPEPARRYDDMTVTPVATDIPPTVVAEPEVKEIFYQSKTSQQQPSEPAQPKPALDKPQASNPDDLLFAKADAFSFKSSSHTDVAEDMSAIDKMASSYSSGSNTQGEHAQEHSGRRDGYGNRDYNRGGSDRNRGFGDGDRNRGYGEGDRNRGYGEGDRNRGYGEGDRNRGYGEGDRNRGYGEGDRNRGYGEGDRNRGYGDGDRNRGFGDGDRNRGYGDGDRNRGYGDGERNRGYGDRNRGYGDGDRNRGDGDRNRGDGDRNRGDGDRNRGYGQGNRGYGFGDGGRSHGDRGNSNFGNHDHRDEEGEKQRRRNFDQGNNSSNECEAQKPYGYDRPSSRNSNDSRSNNGRSRRQSGSSIKSNGRMSVNQDQPRVDKFGGDNYDQSGESNQAEKSPSVAKIDFSNFNWSQPCGEPNKEDDHSALKSTTRALKDVSKIAGGDGNFGGNAEPNYNGNGRPDSYNY